MGRLYSNYASTTLSDDLNAVDTTFTVENGSGELSLWPVLGPEDYVICTIEGDDGVFEIIKVTDINLIGQTFTAVRGDSFASDDPDKTTSLSFSMGARVEIRATAGSFAGLLQKGGDTIYGGVYGDTPAAPAFVNRIITKHSTDTTPAGDAVPTTDDLEMGEIAVNPKTGKVYVGSTTDLDVPYVREIVPGFFIGTATPTGANATEGHLWFDTNATVMSLKMYANGSYRNAFGRILPNATALRSLLSNGTDVENLIKITNDDKVEVGFATTVLLSLLGTMVQLGPTLRLLGTSGKLWDLVAGSGGNSSLALIPGANNQGLTITVKQSDGTSHDFVLKTNGNLTLPVDPAVNSDAVNKGYVDGAISDAISQQPSVVVPIASGRFEADSDGVGTFVGCSGAYGGFAIYDVTLSDPASSANNIAVIATIEGTSNASAGTVMYQVVDSDTIRFRTFEGGSADDIAQRAFSFVVYDRGL